jgi:hypothetical protein
MNRFSALLLIFVLSACEKEEPVLSEEPFCVEGEFRQVNPNCVMDSAVGDGIIYDIRIYNHSDLDSITVPGEDIPNAFRVKGNRFYSKLIVQEYIVLVMRCSHLLSLTVFQMCLLHLVAKRLIISR